MPARIASAMRPKTAPLCALFCRKEDGGDEGCEGDEVAEAATTVTTVVGTLPDVEVMNEVTSEGNESKSGAEGDPERDDGDASIEEEWVVVAGAEMVEESEEFREEGRREENERRSEVGTEEGAEEGTDEEGTEEEESEEEKSDEGTAVGDD